MADTVLFDGKLTLTCPDGFHLMNEKEKKNVSFFGDSAGECLSDPGRHIMISIGLKTVGRLTALITDAGAAAKAAEANIRKPMRQYGYCLDGFAERTVGGKTAPGFGYGYEAQGVAMYGETCVVKDGRTFCYFNLYARAELKEESLRLWNEILSSAEWN